MRKCRICNAKFNPKQKLVDKYSYVCVRCGLYAMHATYAISHWHAAYVACLKHKLLLPFYRYLLICCTCWGSGRHLPTQLGGNSKPQALRCQQFTCCQAVVVVVAAVVISLLLGWQSARKLTSEPTTRAYQSSLRTSCWQSCEGEGGLVCVGSSTKLMSAS